MSLWKLRLSMFGTLAIIIGLSTIFFAFLLNFIGFANIFLTLTLVVAFNLAQWLFAPYLVGAMYRTKEVSASQAPELHAIIDNLVRKSNLEKPKVMIADIPLPNAFAYGSPLSGKRIAVTKGLLDKLNFDEVGSVLGHELGHLKHRDVQLMMFLSVLPAIFYYVGWTFYMSSSGSQKKNNIAPLIGIISIALYFVLNIFVLYVSRLREYYADRFSSKLTPDGANKLSSALAKIVTSTHAMRSRTPSTKGLSGFKSLFISDPDRATQDFKDLSGLSSDKLVEEVLSRKISAFDRFVEIFSTHPNIVKRLRALQELS